MSYTQPGQSFASQSFAGGYLETEADTLPPSATPEAKNALLINVERAGDASMTPRAVLRKRLGSRLINPTAMTSGATVDGLFEFLRDNAAAELLAVCNGVLRRFDNVDSFTSVTGGTGFTAGNATRMLAFRNNAIVADGLQNLRYNGTACFGVGFVAPTAAPALAAVAGPGLTGTYEGLAVWYDSVTDHESSPSATSAAVALTNQQRQWTKPTGSPPTNVDFWRIYCRRTDTNERNFFRSAQVAIGTANVTESVSDAARTEPGPNPNDNDVPPAFAVLEEYKGYRLAAKLNSSDLYISKQYDAESQHPKFVFPVGGKGDTKPVRAIRKYGEQCLVQKPRRTYRLVGDRAPFQIIPVDSSFGNVSQDTALEVRGWYYGWDEAVGPYRTNLGIWDPLAENRIATTLRTVNQTALDQIRAVHVSAPYNLILWAVPTLGSGRKRTLLAYHYVLDRWLPPMTGFEYSSLVSFTTTAGLLGTYFGDYWGRVYELFSGDVDGPPSGIVGPESITAATASTITIGSIFNTFYTTGSGLAGMPAAVKSPAGVWQWVRIQSNTGTVLTLDTTNGPSLSPVPVSDGSWLVYVGGIEWFWKTPQSHQGTLLQKKVGRWLVVGGETTAPTHDVDVTLYLNRHRAYARRYQFRFPAAGLIWGVGLWGVGIWGESVARTTRKRRIERSYFTVQLQFENFYPNQPVLLTHYAVMADVLPQATVSSA